MTVPTVTLLSEGKAIDPAFELLAIDIQREVDRIPSAEITLIDGDPAEQRFAISDLPLFEPGRSLEVRLRMERERNDATLFRGVVTAQAVEADGRSSLLRVEARDIAVAMTRVRRSTDYAKRGEDAIFRAIIGRHAVRAGRIPGGLPEQPQMVQYDATDWDFLLSRADALGLLVVVDDGELSLLRPTAAERPEHRITWGLDEVYELEMQADGGEQFRSVAGVGWDPRKQARTRPAKAAEPARRQGDLEGGRIAGRLRFEAATLAHPVDLPADELRALADARLQRSRLALLRGRLSLPGSARYRLLDPIAIDGVGRRFNGTAAITGLRHRIDHGGWRTDVQFGLDPQRFCRRPNLQQAPAGGLLPAVGGLQIGIVEALADDPDGQFRVKLRLPLFDAESRGIWARLAQPDAGPGRGFCFRPEPGDEVVVGFFANDPRQAVILGALHSAANPPPKPWAQAGKDNVHRAIVSRQGTTVGFIDQDQAALLIETAGGNRVTIDDAAGAIELADQHGNRVLLNGDGIRLDSAKGLDIEAAGDIRIKGNQVEFN